MEASDRLLRSFRRWPLEKKNYANLHAPRKPMNETALIWPQKISRHLNETATFFFLEISASPVERLCWKEGGLRLENTKVGRIRTGFRQSNAVTHLLRRFNQRNCALVSINFLTKFNETGGRVRLLFTPKKNIRRTWPIVQLRANFLSLAAKNVARIEFKLMALEKFVKFENFLAAVQSHWPLNRMWGQDGIEGTTPFCCLVN